MDHIIEIIAVIGALLVSLGTAYHSAGVKKNVDKLWNLVDESSDAEEEDEE